VATQNPVIGQLEHLVSALLTAWEADGNPVGIDKHLQLRVLLQNLPAEANLAQLKTVLAPLFAANEQQQNDFYRLYDATVEAIGENAIAHSEAMEREKRYLVQDAVKRKVLYFFRRNFVDSVKEIDKYWTRKNVRFLWAIPILALLVALGVFGFFAKKDTEHAYEYFIKANLFEPNASASCLRMPDNATFGRISGHPTHVEILSEQASGSQICFRYKAKSVGRDTLDYHLFFSDNSSARVRLIFISNFFRNLNPRKPDNIIGVTFPAPAERQQPVAPKDSSQAIAPMDTLTLLLDSAHLADKLGRYVTDLSSSWQFGWGHAYFSFEKALIVLAVALLMWLLGVWARHKGQKFALQHLSGKKPPYEWTLRIPFLSSVAMDEKFYAALTEMRRRSAGESRRLDMPRTLHSTVENAGMISLRYRLHHRTKDYLALIDIQSAQNHRAKLFEYIVTLLRENEAPVERFFFDGNPRKCWNEQHPHGIPLEELSHKYAEHQLIVFGVGEQFLEPSSGELHDWTQVFSIWRQRVMLTPHPAAEWNTRESALSRSFRLLPATPHGLAALVETLEAVEPKNYLLWKRQPDDKHEPVSLPADIASQALLAILEKEFVAEKNGQRDERLLRWIVACAVPPVLFWDWTLYVGQMLALPGEPYLNSNNLYALCRLSWFVEGKMPDATRKTLVAWCEEKYPAWLDKVRREWQRVLELEQNLPPVGSIAWQGHRIQVVSNALLQKPGYQRRRRLELELDALLLNNPHQDAMAVHYLENKKDPVGAVLSDRFRKFVQKKHGIIWQWRDWTWQMPVILFTFLATLLINYTEPVTTFKFKEYTTAAAFAPDSKSFLVATGAGAIGMCGTDGRWIRGIEAQRDKVVALGYSPNGDVIFSGSSKNDLMIWDTKGNPIRALPPSNENLVTSIAFSPNGKSFLVGYYNGKAALHNMENGALLQTYESHKEAIQEVAFSPDGEYVATCGSDSVARIWTLQGQLLQTFQGHSGIVYAVEWSPDGTQILTGSRDNTAKLWSMGGTLLYTFKGHKSDVFDVHFAPDGKSLLTASGDATIKLWSTEGALLRTLEGHRNAVKVSAFSPDAMKILTGDAEGVVKIWRFR